MGSHPMTAGLLALGLVAGPAVRSDELVANALPTTPLTFVGIVPCRLADTRDSTFPPGYGPPALPAGSPRNFTLTDRCGIPTTALAVTANVTVVNPQGQGYLLIRPADGPNVLVSTLNFIPGQTVANGAVIPLGTGGAATFLAGVTGTQLIIDVNGYFTEGGGGGDITGVTAGSGLSGGGTSGDVTLAVNPATTQSRVAGTCPAGSSIRTVAQDGSVTCETDDGAVYGAGNGLVLVGTVFGTDNTVVARKDTAGGNQTFDGGTLFLDYANNRVGVNTATPAAGNALDVVGTVRATDFTYVSPQTHHVIADPATCIRALSYEALHLEMATVTPPANTVGPSIASTNGAPNGVFDYYCSIPLAVPATGTLTLTGARLAYLDAAPTCRVQAQLRYKSFGSQGNGTILATVHGGADATDFAFVDNPAVKAFPAFALPVPPDRLVWVNATIAFDATGGGANNCRYSGVILDYTVTGP